MVTRNRIKIPERLLAVRWQWLVGVELRDKEDKGFAIIYPGRINGDSGPDFRDAVIAINGSDLVKGDVEVHVNSSDWYRHGHHNDPGYNSVIVHLVRWDDCDVTLRQDGKSVPVLCLSTALASQARSRSHYLPCSQVLNRGDGRILKKVLSIAGEERFKQKAALFQARLRQEEAGQVLFQGMMRALGYSKNMGPFEELAQKVSLSFVEKAKPRESLILKQAWLLGMAGLLPCQRLKGGFSKEGKTKELEELWQWVAKGAKTMSENDWNFSHVYPNNSPVRRIVAQSYVIQRYNESGLLMGILQLAKEVLLLEEHRRLENGLIVFDEGYWQDHFDFDLKTRKSALLGYSKASEIVINVVLPFVFVWGEKDEPELSEKALKLYLSYPKIAENEITRHMARQLCLKDANFTACQQQGLIHIFKNYCREGRCSQCSLAN